eukprot:c12513_g1_i1 orf=735-1307(-)
MDAASPHHRHPDPHRQHAPPPHGNLVKIICKVDKTFNLGVHNGAPAMVPADSGDSSQIWLKDQTYGERTKDNYGSPAFALVNQDTKMVLKHGNQKGHQLILAEYQPYMLDEDVLFSESQDFGEGFKTIRMASDTLLNMTLFHAALFQKEEKKSLFHHSSNKAVIEVKTGTPLVLDTWHENDTQLWKIFTF